MGTGATVRPGELYASRDEESRRYQVTKVLYADESVVVCRLYANRFDERPTEVPQDLRLDLTLDELERGEIGIGWGAPLPSTGRASQTRSSSGSGRSP
jgi:hypothetical protein